MPIPNEILAYNASQSPTDNRICTTLAKAIDRHLPDRRPARKEGRPSPPSSPRLSRSPAVPVPDREAKIWHRHPVWFLAGNPIVGYSKLKDCIRLLFWSGQSFDEPALTPEGSFKAAEARYTTPDQVSPEDLERWLKKSAEIQWDYKNIVKRKGKLERLK